MNYVLAVVRQLNGGNSGVVIRARGKSISKAVNVALITKDRFVETSELEGIKISTEVLTNDDGKVSNVSSIEIAMRKP